MTDRGTRPGSDAAVPTPAAVLAPPARPTGPVPWRRAGGLGLGVLPAAARTGRLDVAGLGLLTTAVVALLLAVERAASAEPWPVTVLLGLLALGTGCLVALVRVERRAADPVVPPSLFARPRLAWVLTASALLGALLYGSVFYLPTFLQAALGLGPTVAGLGVLPYVAAFAAASALSGRWIDRRDSPRPVLVGGASTTLIAAAALASLTPGSDYPEVAARLVLLGAGVGLVMQPLVTLGQTIVADREIGVASAVILTARGFGGALGVAAFGALLSRRLAAATGDAETLATAIPSIFVLGIPLAALLLLAVAAATRPAAPGR